MICNHFLNLWVVVLVNYKPNTNKQRKNDKKKQYTNLKKVIVKEPVLSESHLYRLCHFYAIGCKNMKNAQISVRQCTV